MGIAGIIVWLIGVTSLLTKSPSTSPRLTKREQPHEPSYPSTNFLTFTVSMWCRVYRVKGIICGV